MKNRKTPANRRGTYTYRFNDDTSLTLIPGEDGVTEADIKILHSLDDAEVHNNLKHLGPTLAEKEKKKWKEEHPQEKYPRNWNLSLDCTPGEDDDADKGSFAMDTAVEVDWPDETEEEMVRRLLPFLTETQQKVYRLVKVDGYTRTEAAELLGTSLPNVSRHLKKAQERIQKEKEKILERG